MTHFAGGGKAHPGAWTEQSQVVVETVTKSTTTQKFAAATSRATADASKVVTRGAGLKRAFVDKPQTFQVDASSAGKHLNILIGYVLPKYYSVVHEYIVLSSVGSCTHVVDTGGHCDVVFREQRAACGCVGTGESV